MSSSLVGTNEPKLYNVIAVFLSLLFVSSLFCLLFVVVVAVLFVWLFSLSCTLRPRCIISSLFFALCGVCLLECISLNAMEGWIDWMCVEFHSRLAAR